MKHYSMSKENKGILEITAVFLFLWALPAAGRYIFTKMDFPGSNIVIMLALNYLMAAGSLVLTKVHRISTKELGFWKERLMRQVLVGIGIFAIVFFVCVYLPAVLGISSYAPLDSVQDVIVESLLNIFVISVSEELAFRGFLYARIVQLSNNKRLAVFLTALMFAAVHIQGFSIGYVRKFFFILINGTVWGVCRAKGKDCSLLSLIIAHGLHNTMIAVFAFWVF